MELNDSKYLEKEVKHNYIIIYYCPAFKKIYCELLDDKSAESSSESLEHFIEYIKDMPDLFVETIKTD